MFCTNTKLNYMLGTLSTSIRYENYYFTNANMLESPVLFYYIYVVLSVVDFLKLVVFVETDLI